MTRQQAHGVSPQLCHTTWATSTLRHWKSDRMNLGGQGKGEEEELVRVCSKGHHSPYAPRGVQDGAGACRRVADHHRDGQGACRVHGRMGEVHLVAPEIITDKAGYVQRKLAAQGGLSARRKGTEAAAQGPNCQSHYGWTPCGTCASQASRLLHHFLHLLPNRKAAKR